VILAAFTYTSGLRAPAAIAVVKDVMIYAVIFAAVGVLIAHFGGFSAIFAAVPPEKIVLPTPPVGSTGTYGVYATLALGSAAALFLYPHAITAVRSSSSRNVICRNSAVLHAYSLVLAFLTLLGFIALAVGVKNNPAYAALFAKYSNSFAVPALILDIFPPGLRASPSRPSASARYCRPPSCRSPPRTCGPATSTSNSSTRPRRLVRRPGW